MAPNDNKSSYLPSSAHIFGIAVVNGATSVPNKPRTVLIEAIFWNGQEPVLGLFRYYNAAPGILFERDQKCFIHSTVARFEREAVLRSQEAPPDVDDEFDVMGDIFYIIPLQGVSAKFLPTVLVTGKPSKIMQEALTFEIDVRQWVNFGKEKALFPFSGTVPRNGRWNENNRPFPNPNNPKYMSVIGFLTGILSEDGKKRFSIEIDSMHFLGAAPQTLPTTLTPTPKGKRKATVNFDDTPSKKTK